MLVWRLPSHLFLSSSTNYQLQSLKIQCQTDTVHLILFIKVTTQPLQQLTATALTWSCWEQVSGLVVLAVELHKKNQHHTPKVFTKQQQQNEQKHPSTNVKQIILPTSRGKRIKSNFHFFPSHPMSLQNS